MIAEKVFVPQDVAKWIDVGINFRKAFIEDDDNEWRDENRPHVNITLKKTIAEFEKKYGKVKAGYPN